MSSQVTIVVERRSRRRWAAYGFLLIAALMTISWLSAPGVLSWLKVTYRPVRDGLRTMPPLHQQLAITLVLFILLGLLSALVVTLFAPKHALDVKDKDLQKERLDAVEYRRKARKRQRTLNREMREYVEKNQK